MSRGRLLALSFIGALLGAGFFAGPAAAHLPRFAPVVDVVPEPAAAPDRTPALLDLAWTAAPTPAGVPWYLVVALSGLAALGARRPRRNLALALVLLLAIFAFENGLHSVHHLNDQDRGESCAVASASQHVAGTEVEGGLTGRRARAGRAHQGRLRPRHPLRPLARPARGSRSARRSRLAVSGSAPLPLP